MPSRRSSSSQEPRTPSRARFHTIHPRPTPNDLEVALGPGVYAVRRGCMESQREGKHYTILAAPLLGNGARAVSNCPQRVPYVGTLDDALRRTSLPMGLSLEVPSNGLCRLMRGHGDGVRAALCARCRAQRKAP